MVQLSHLYMTTGKTIALTIWTFVSKVMSVLFFFLYVYIYIYIHTHTHINTYIYTYIHIYTYIQAGIKIAGGNTNNLRYANESEVKMKVTQSCLFYSMDYTVHGILQARILEWVALPFSRRSSQPRDQTQVSCITDKFFTS